MYLFIWRVWHQQYKFCWQFSQSDFLCTNFNRIPMAQIWTDAVQYTYNNGRIAAESVKMLLQLQKRAVTTSNRNAPAVALRWVDFQQFLEQIILTQLCWKNIAAEAVKIQLQLQKCSCFRASRICSNFKYKCTCAKLQQCICANANKTLWI